MASTSETLQRLARLRRKLWEAKVWLSGLGLAVVSSGLLYWAAGMQVPDLQVPVTPVALGFAGVVLLALGRLAGSYETEAGAVADGLAAGAEPGSAPDRRGV